MLTLRRTTSDDPAFRQLVSELDHDLAIRNGETNAFFAQYNTIDLIRHVVIAFDGNEPAGCGAMKEYDAQTMEIKRMFVRPALRGKGIARKVLEELHQWAASLGYTRCILETGQKMPEAIALYTKSQYRVIPNYGQYEGIASSICFERML